MRTWMFKIRTRQKMSQREVAKKLKARVQWYCSIELGQRQVDMNLSTVLKLAEVFGLSVEQVIKNEKAYVRSLARKEKANAKEGNQI